MHCFSFRKTGILFAWISRSEPLASNSNFIFHFSFLYLFYIFCIIKNKHKTDKRVINNAVDSWEEQTFTALPYSPPHSPFRPHPPLPREQDSRTGRANRTRSGPAPSFAQGGAGRYAPHLLPHSRENRTRKWKAQGPRLLICAGGAERYAPLLQPHSRDSRTRKRSAQPHPFRPPPSIARKRGHNGSPLPDCPQPPLTREPDAPTNTQGSHPPLVPPCLPRAQGVAPPSARRPFARKRGV